MAEREGQSSNLFVKFGRDLLVADKRASTEKGKDKDGKYGSRPSERLAGSAVMMLLGVGLEWAADKMGPKVIKELGKKFDVDNLAIPVWANEAVTDAGAAIAYAVVQKQLGEQLPKLKPQDLLTLAVDVGAYGGDRVAEDVGNTVRKIVKAEANTQTHALERLTNWLNPVTAGAVREGLSAGSDLWAAYRDVVAGVPEAAEEIKEPSVIKETTIIYLGNDQQIASIAS